MSSANSVNPPASSDPSVGVNGDAHARAAAARTQASAEQRPPQRVASAHDSGGGGGGGSFDDITIGPGVRARRPADDDVDADDDDDDLDESLTPEEIERETERWAPSSIRDTVVDVEKICRVCGKDLKGHRRYKDERGYICRSCEHDDRARRIACAECGKAVPPEALRPWGPISICTRCWADHESDPKQRIKRKVSSRKWEEMERQTVLVIAGVALVGLLILFVLSLIT